MRLDQIQDLRLREQIARQLCSGVGPPPPCRSQGQLLDNRGKPEACGPALERDLHDQIIDLCRSRGWFYVHSRMDRKSTTGVGTPDFVIALPGGATLWLECKRKGGKTTTEQAAALAQLRRNGHLACVVDSFEAAELQCLVTIKSLEKVGLEALVAGVPRGVPPAPEPPPGSRQES